MEAISFREEKKLTEKPKLQTQSETLDDDKLKVMRLGLSTVFLGTESVPNNHLLILLTWTSQLKLLNHSG